MLSDFRAPLGSAATHYRYVMINKALHTDYGHAEGRVWCSCSENIADDKIGPDFAECSAQTDLNLNISTT